MDDQPVAGGQRQRLSDPQVRSSDRRGRHAPRRRGPRAAPRPERRRIIRRHASASSCPQLTRTAFIPAANRRSSSGSSSAISGDRVTMMRVVRPRGGDPSSRSLRSARTAGPSSNPDASRGGSSDSSSPVARLRMWSTASTLDKTCASQRPSDDSPARGASPGAGGCRDDGAPGNERDFSRWGLAPPRCRSALARSRPGTAASRAPRAGARGAPDRPSSLAVLLSWRAPPFGYSPVNRWNRWAVHEQDAGQRRRHVGPFGDLREMRARYHWFDAVRA